MRSVNVAELKNRLSKFLKFARAGEEVVIRDRNLPVAKLIPFSAEGADDQELLLVAAGKLRLPQTRLDVKELLKIRMRYPPRADSGFWPTQATLVLPAKGRSPDSLNHQS